MSAAEAPKGTGTVYDIPDEKLIERAIRNVRGRGRVPRWSAVADQFGLGSTYSAQLCARFGLESRRDDRPARRNQKAGCAMKPIRTYEITVLDFPPALYSARSPAKARARCWRDYCHLDREATFADFLKMSSIRRVPDPPGIGERILVLGVPATRVIGYGQYTHFMRDGSDVILCAHPADVAPISQGDRAA
jgi:hypothetical protein